MASCALHTAQPEHSYFYSKNVVYKKVDGKSLTGDFFIPNPRPNEKSKLRPAVLVVHGGGWSSRFGDMQHICRALARSGFIAFNINYRLAPEAKFPKPVEDVTDALKWLYSNAEKYGIDRDRISGWGYSAGAHLTLMAGLDPKHHMHSIVAGGSPGDLRITPENTTAIRFIGAPYKNNEDLWTAASPVTYAEANSPPTFFYHGTEDTTVEPIQVKTISGALKAKGAKTEIFWLEGRGHIGVYVFAREAIEKGIQFLKTN